MLNKSGITKTVGTNVNQILAIADTWTAVGIVVDDAVTSQTVDGNKIVKAGTPIKVNLSDRTVPAVLANATVVMNAVLLHDVDVTSGDANGTALLFGFVNLNRIDTTTQALITTALTAEGISPLLTFMKA